MLNFRNTNIFFLLLFIVLIWASTKYGLPLYIYPAVFIIYSLIVFWGCYYIGSNFFIPVVCSADTEKKEIAISFDDGPVTGYTPEILQLLKQEDIKAAFFCIGKRVKENGNILRQLNDEGHVIGNHSYSHHNWFDLFPAQKMLDDMKMMDAEVKKIIGYEPKLFRPPYGVTNPNLKKAIINGRYTPVGWSVRSMDTVAKDKVTLLDKITTAIEPGAVFLFHDTCKITLEVLPEFIKEVKNRGYNIVRLDKLLHLEPYA